MLTTSIEVRTDNVVMRLVGALDASTYPQVRDAVTKVAAEGPAAVVIDIDGLEVPGDQAWAVFTRARWHIQQRPEVVIALACSDAVVRQRLTDLSITRYVPVYSSVAAATAEISDGSCRYLHRAREKFGPHSFAVHAAQIFVREHLMAWSMLEKIPVVSTVATVFVENALNYTRHGCDVRLEADNANVLVAVSDTSSKPPIRRERAPGSIPRGLDIVAALCRRWGSTPTSVGKTMWAHVGPDDTLAGISQLLH
jgi:anti-anti-sigma regulatory factor